MFSPYCFCQIGSNNLVCTLTVNLTADFCQRMSSTCNLLISALLYYLCQHTCGPMLFGQLHSFIWHPCLSQQGTKRMPSIAVIKFVGCYWARGKKIEEFFVYIIERIIVTFSSSVSIGLCFAPYAPVLCVCLLLFLFDASPVLSKVEMPCCSSFCFHLTQLICQLYSVSPTGALISLVVTTSGNVESYGSQASLLCYNLLPAASILCGLQILGACIR